MEEPTPQYLEYVRNVRQYLLPVIQKATVPFYAFHEKEIHRGHTGVLLRIGFRYLLLTASHGFRELLAAKIPLFVGWDPDERRMIHLAGTDFHMGEVDTCDVAFATLTTDQAKALLKRHSAISIQQMTDRDYDVHSMYLLCGYPQAWLHRTENKEVASQPLNYNCFRYEGEREGADSTLKFDANMHCLFSLERIGTNAETGEEIVLPHTEGIKGISGCGIWRIGQAKGGVLTKFGPDDIELCAIEHSYNEKKGYVIGTWAGYIVAGIIDRYPEITKVLALHPHSLKW